MKRQLGSYIDDSLINKGNDNNILVEYLKIYPEILSLILIYLSPEDLVNLLLSRILILQRNLYDEKYKGNGLYNAFENYLKKYKDILIPLSNSIIYNDSKKEFELFSSEKFDVDFFQSQLNKSKQFRLIRAMFKYGLCLCEYCKNIVIKGQRNENIRNYNISNQVSCIFICNSCNKKEGIMWLSSSELRKMVKTKQTAEDYSFSIIRCHNNFQHTRYFKKDVIKKLQDDEIEKINKEWYQDAVYINTESNIRKKVTIKQKTIKMYTLNNNK